MKAGVKEMCGRKVLVIEIDRVLNVALGKDFNACSDCGRDTQELIIELQDLKPVMENGRNVGATTKIWPYDGECEVG